MRAGSQRNNARRGRALPKLKHRDVVYCEPKRGGLVSCASEVLGRVRGARGCGATARALVKNCRMSEAGPGAAEGKGVPGCRAAAAQPGRAPCTQATRPGGCRNGSSCPSRRPCCCGGRLPGTRALGVPCRSGCGTRPRRAPGRPLQILVHHFLERAHVSSVVPALVEGKLHSVDLQMQGQRQRGRDQGVCQRKGAGSRDRWRIKQIIRLWVGETTRGGARWAMQGRGQGRGDDVDKGGQPWRHALPSR